MKKDYELLLNELDRRKSQVIDYLVSDSFTKSFKPSHMKEAILSYILAGGKSLRPAILMLSCGAVNGNEELALPAASAVEVYHTWSLVHDDIIDQDATRRGHPTVHTQFAKKAIEDLNLDGREAEHYGVSIGILAGDAQLGWAVRLLCDLEKVGVSRETILELMRMLTWEVLNTLIEGETLDVQYSKLSFNNVSEELILDMLWKKTGILYEFAGSAGAMIGLNSKDRGHPWIKSIGRFTSQCGTAFQLKDDILGIVGNEKTLGKPVGADIREGKMTIIVHYALRHANTKEREKLLSVLGNSAASDTEINETIELLKKLGGIDKTYELAQKIISEAMKNLNNLPASQNKSLLKDWANFLVERDF